MTSSSSMTGFHNNNSENINYNYFNCSIKFSGNSSLHMNGTKLMAPSSSEEATSYVLNKFSGDLFSLVDGNKNAKYDSKNVFANCYDKNASLSCFMQRELVFEDLYINIMQIFNMVSCGAIESSHANQTKYFNIEEYPDKHQRSEIHVSKNQNKSRGKFIPKFTKKTRSSSKKILMEAQTKTTFPNYTLFSAGTKTHRQFDTNLKVFSNSNVASRNTNTYPVSHKQNNTNNEHVSLKILETHPHPSNHVSEKAYLSDVGKMHSDYGKNNVEEEAGHIPSKYAYDIGKMQSDYRESNGEEEEAGHIPSKYAYDMGKMQSDEEGQSNAEEVTVHNKTKLPATCHDKKELDDCFDNALVNFNVEGLPHTKEQLMTLCR